MPPALPTLTASGIIASGYSYDRENWLRHETNLTDGVLSFDFIPGHDSVYFAYFAPYSMERHHRLIAEAQTAAHCSHRLLGQTLTGRTLICSGSV